MSDEQVRQILEAGRWAPSAGNVQDWQFFVIRNQSIKEALVEAALGQSFIAEAPVVIVVATDLNKIEESYGRRGRDTYSLQNTAAAIQNMLLMIHSMGLGACWVGAFYEQSASGALNLKEHIRPVAIVPIGYTAEKVYPVGREELDQFTHWME